MRKIDFELRVVTPRRRGRSKAPTKGAHRRGACWLPRGANGGLGLQESGTIGANGANGSMSGAPPSGNRPPTDPVTLEALVANPARIGELSVAKARQVFLQLISMLPLLAARISERASVNGGTPGEPAQESISTIDLRSDRLLTAKEAGALLGYSPRSLYRMADRLPFTIRLGGHLRFSYQGIQRMLQSVSGLNARS